MPTYLFKNNETGEEFEQFMGISEADEFLKQNPHIEKLVNGAPLIGDPMRLGRIKPPEVWRDHLREMKKKHYKNDINVL